MSAIEIRNVTKYYGKSRGVEDLSLSVAEGDIFGFIGPNGAGKSTTIRILLNFIFPDSGSAAILGRDVVREAAAIRKSVGYMPSEVHFYGDRKISELLEYSRSFYGSCGRQRMNMLTDMLDLDVSRKFENLSFGNKKKVSIVQAFMHSPSIVILDEPTTGLDPLVQQTFFKLLLEEHGKGTTIFFSSHTLSEVQKLCKNVGIIRNGGMVNVEEIETLRKKHLRRVFLESRGPVDCKSLEGEDISDLSCNGNTAEFYYKGEINSLISRLGSMDLRDFSMREPELEEIFMHYYSREGSDDIET
ncbi:MAG: ABC transporter ATP-binding protein [Clostridia bacterium]